jgi:hypothetical protein
MSLRRWKSLRSAISRSARRWRERANHLPTFERVPAMNPLICAFERDRALGATSQKDSQWAIKVDMAGLRCWCRAAAPARRSGINRSRQSLRAKHRYSGLPEFYLWRRYCVALSHS